MNADKPDYKLMSEKWLKKWEEGKVFTAVDSSKKPKYYVLEMFPYPSATGLHMGHALNYTIGDIQARFYRMKGKEVLYPMGYDAFGLPAENAAIKAGEHPLTYTENSMKNFILQQKALGLSYDWERMVVTCRPEYYKWNQHFFIKLFEKGLVYRKKASVNWCPECNTVLANEQVHAGKCWRHDNTEVEMKQLEQWFIKTTQYSDELLEGIKKLDWPENIKLMQENWIGKSEGTEVDFEIEDIHKKTNFVLLHGFRASPDENFFPWLKKELEFKGYKVTVPKLPNTNDPSVLEQRDYILQNCPFDEDTVLLGHSLGCPVALKVLEKLDKPVKKLVLAAGFVQKGFSDKKRVFEEKFNWEFDFNKIKKNAGEVILLRTQNDTAVPQERSLYIQEKIGGKIIDFTSEENHICGKKEPMTLKSCLNNWPVFTTRIDTIFGVTFIVVAAQHPRLNELVTSMQKSAVNAFLKKIKSVSEKEEALEKEGVFTGSYAINPLSGEKIPVYAGNFVIADYGSGMVMAVPGHDQRDFEFAKKYNIPIKKVIDSEGESVSIDYKAFTNFGVLVNSKHYSGLKSEDAIKKLQNELEKNNIGKKTFNYKFRDWLVSRQRYWGTPIPFVYCNKCGCNPVAIEELPVLLPKDVKFGTGNPLATNLEFVNTKCAICKGGAKRETDTMDTFFDSSWYYLRYLDNRNNKEPFNKKKTEDWMPADLYIGGAEHACMHLIYARFFTKALRDLNLLSVNEPFVKLFNQGFLHGSDGNKMSKSLGNVINPREMIDKYSADALRFNLMSLASPDSASIWNDNNMESSHKFIAKVYNWLITAKHYKESNKRAKNKLAKTILAVESDIENFKYNHALIKIRDAVEYLKNEELSKEGLETFAKILHPFCPFITEEVFEILGNKYFISNSNWPKALEADINEKIDAADDIINNTVADIHAVRKLAKIEKAEKITIIVSAAWKYEFYVLLKGELEKTRNAGDLLKAVMSTPLKQYGGEISKIAPALVKDPSKLPNVLLTQKEEFEALIGSTERLEELFDANVMIMLAEDSKEAKAKNAGPAKPAIVMS